MKQRKQLYKDRKKNSENTKIMVDSNENASFIASVKVTENQVPVCFFFRLPFRFTFLVYIHYKIDTIKKKNKSSEN